MGLLSLINTAGLSASAVKKRDVGVLPLTRDPFAPNYKLIVRGGVGAQPFELTDEVTKYIDSIEFEDNSDQFSRFTIEFKNQADNAGGGAILSLLDSKLLAEGHIIEFQFGYGRSLRTIGAGIITKKTPDFPEDGFPSFTIEGFDLLFRATRRRPKGGVSYKGFRDSQIASIIGERNGFDIRINDPRSFAGIRYTPGVFDRTQKKGISDYEFLKKVADINGYEVFSRFDTDRKKFALFFQPPSTANWKEVFVFAYNAGDLDYAHKLLALQPTLDAGDQSTDFELFFIKDKAARGTKFNFINQLTVDESRKIKEAQERRFTGGNAGPQGGKQLPENDGLRYAFKAFGRSFKFPPHKRFKTEFEARRAVEEFIKRQKENFITARGKIIGNEAIQSRQVHRFEGLGEQFSGKYFFTQVVHRMSKSDGYQCEFTCRKLIEDFIVQSPPTLNLSANDKLIERIKKER